MLANQTDPFVNTLMQIHDGKTHVGEFLCLIFGDLPIGVFWKDLHSVYQGCNKHTAIAAGFCHPIETINRTDFDMSWTEDESILFRKEDQFVIKTLQPKFNMIERQHRNDKQCHLISVTKMPLYDAVGQISGIVGFFSEVSTAANFGLLRSSNESLKIFYQNFKNGNTCYILKDTQIVRLTSKQAEVLTHLSMGKTVKQIAILLNCASATIEDHIYYLKRKLDACTTSALIDCFWSNPIQWF